MKNINEMVEEALLGLISESDIEEAVCDILDGIDIGDILRENCLLRDTVYDNVFKLVSNVIEMYL